MTLVGINVDPRNNPPNGRAYIAITDGGGVELSGFTTFEESPEIMRTYGVLEHEVAHNFLSRDNCGTYDSGEHAAPDPHNILSIGDYMTVELPPSEQAEIQCRVQGDTWWDFEDCCTPCTCPYRPPGCCGP
jgi:hypothetical protein